MKLKYTFEVMEMDDMKIAVPISDGNEPFKGVIRLNESAAVIFDMLKNDVTEEDIVSEIQKIYDVKVSDLELSVRRCIAEFKREGIIE